MWNQKSKYSRIVGIHELPVGDKSLKFYIKANSLILYILVMNREFLTLKIEKHQLDIVLGTVHVF